MRGFSLIELMIVLGMLGLLTLFSYSNYKNYILKAHRTDGQMALLDLANLMENYYAEHHSYETATLATGGSEDIRNSNLSAQGWYQLRISEQSSTTYTLEAIPLKSQVADKACQTLSIDYLGIKGPAHPANNLDSPCWSE